LGLSPKVFQWGELSISPYLLTSHTDVTIILFLEIKVPVFSVAELKSRDGIGQFQFGINRISFVPEWNLERTSKHAGELESLSYGVETLDISV
jgi:hypothetical protein